MSDPEQATLGDYSHNTVSPAETHPRHEHISGLQEQFETPDSISVDASFEIVNIQATTDIGVEVNLDALDEDSSQIEKGGGQCAIHLSDLDGDCVWLYASGTVCIHGVTTSDDLIDVVEQVHDLLRSVGVQTEWGEISITNMVVQFDPPNSVTSTPVKDELESVSTRVNLTKCYTQIKGFEYDPETFPGGIYRTERDDMTCLLFNNGKTTVQGSESVDDAINRREELVEQLNNNDIIG